MVRNHDDKNIPISTAFIFGFKVIIILKQRRDCPAAPPGLFRRRRPQFHQSRLHVPARRGKVEDPPGVNVVKPFSPCH
jgi:hypothetical protein